MDWRIFPSIQELRDDEGYSRAYAAVTCLNFLMFLYLFPLFWSYARALMSGLMGLERQEFMLMVRIEQDEILDPTTDNDSTDSEVLELVAAMPLLSLEAPVFHMLAICDWDRSDDNIDDTDNEDWNFDDREPYPGDDH